MGGILIFSNSTGEFMLSIPSGDQLHSWDSRQITWWNTVSTRGNMRALSYEVLRADCLFPVSLIVDTRRYGVFLALDVETIAGTLGSAVPS